MKYVDAKEELVSKIHYKLVESGLLIVSDETPLDDIDNQQAAIRESVESWEDEMLLMLGTMRALAESV